MKLDILDTALALSDQDLLARLPDLAGHERTGTAELVGHLAALRLRPSLYAAQGYGSLLFAYCRHALRLSEDAASNRIHAARACLRLPVILDLLASGELSLSAVRMLRPHLTIDNHERVLARARNARRQDIERLVAELAPRPDVPSSVRKLALPTTSSPPPLVDGQPSQAELPAVVMGSSKTLITGQGETDPAGIDAARGRPADLNPARGCPAKMDSRGHGMPHVPRPVVQPLSPGRYRVQFTIGQDAHDTLRRLQTLLRREIPDGDAGAIFERALRLLQEDIEAARFGRATKRGSTARRRPKPGRDRASHDRTAGAERAVIEGSMMSPAATGADPPGAYANRIRPGADPIGTASTGGSVTRAMGPARTRGTTRAMGAMALPQMRSATAHSRYIPRAVKRAVWYRDRGQCAFVSVSGRRCVEQEFLELHHIQPYALNGPATAANIALRCRLHNAYEAETVFGSRAMPPRPRERTSGAAR